MAITTCLQHGCGALLTVKPCWCREHLRACEDTLDCEHGAHYCEDPIHYCDQHAPTEEAE